ncbi:hypothetical protein ACQY0O_000241 [Thecaphora frezii]
MCDERSLFDLFTFAPLDRHLAHFSPFSASSARPTATMTSTERDRKVLDMVFDPEGALGARDLQYEPDPDPCQEDREAIQLEIRAIQAAEAGRSAQALRYLDRAVAASPTWASSYNNRAQLRRITKEPTAAIIKDLNRAIELATNASTSAITRRNAKTLAQAYTQRSAVLFSLLASSLSTEQLRTQIDELRPLGAMFDGTKLARPSNSVEPFSVEVAKMMLEELANRDLSLGARYGNAVAKHVAAQTNPYAKLCGKIVREALVSEYSNRA